MKRLLLVFSALMLSISALWAHDVEIGGIYYNLNGTKKTAEVTYKGSDEFEYSNEYTGSVTIPETITYNSEIYSVTSVGGVAFADCSGLTSITIPNSVTFISYGAFGDCIGLTKVNYLGTVDEWVEIDFKPSGSNPTLYAKDLYINNELLTDVKITFADSIKNSAFYNCRSIKSVEIGNSVTSIGSEAFIDCSGLTEVAIPNSVASIGYDAFRGCSGLTKVNYLGTVDKWVEIDFKPSGSNPTLYAKDLYINNELLTDVKITTADSIKKCAFYNCQSIKSIEIGNSVTSIGDYAFDGCSGLTEVAIPNSVTSIGYNAFNGTGIYNNESNWDNGVLYIDSRLIEAKYDLVNGSYIIKEGTRFIANWTFYGCSGLTSVTIPNSVTTIGENAFEGCSGLTKVNYLGTVDEWVEIDFKGYSSNPTLYAKDFYINNELLTDVKITSADSIKNIAFNYCQSIKSVEIGNSVTSIGDYAFRGCSGLISVTIPTSVTFISNGAFGDCIGLTSVTIPNSVTSIGYEAFYGCSGLTSVTIPNSVTSIGGYAFNGCSGLISVTIPTSVTFISNGAFRDCIGLTSVTIPNSVTSIGYDAFYGCSGLTSVTIPNSVTSIGDYAFIGCIGLTEILVSSNNDDFSSENGVLYNKDKTTLIKYPEGKKDTSFTIPNSVTYIGDGAFYGCNGLTSVTIPNSVTYIGDGAFCGCNGLTSVTIPNSVTSIDSSAFDDCSGLTKVNYLGTVDEWVDIDFGYPGGNPTTFRKDLYINNELLTDVKITTADSIKDYAFYNCQSIKSVVIGDSVTSIGRRAFYGCSGLTLVTIPNSVTSIGSSAFRDCKNLKTVYNCSSLDIVKGSTSNGDVARYADEVINGCPEGDFIVNYEDEIIEYIGDTTVNKIEIPEFVTGIEADVFVHCKNLNKITILSNEVPNAYISSFAHYNAYLYVPCDVHEDYDLDYVFGNFKYIKCIAAEEVEGSDKVEIEVDSNNNATIIWPSTGNASSYELVISKNGEVFCTLLFNENGQLTSIDFGNRSASVGFQFTVTGLDAASKYSYSIVAKDEKGNELESYNGTFTTNGYSEVTAILETLADANITISGGLITCSDAEFTIYNTLGQDVTAYNGSLQPGVYVVSIADDVIKVMVK